MVVKQKPKAKADPLLESIKTPPHSIEAEQSVLGALMLDNSAFDNVVGIVLEHEFYRKEHQLIFRAIHKLSELDKPFDVITLSEDLQSTDELNDAGGLAYLGELAKNTPSASNIKAYAQIVRERAVLRKLIEASNEIADHAYRPEGRSSDDLIDEAEQKIFNIAEKQSKQKSGPVAVKDLVTETVDKIDQLFKLDNPITGTQTGYNDLDMMTSGLQGGDMTVVAGRPSMGKTSFAMNIAEHVAIKSQKNVLVFSMEMPAGSLAMRMMSSLGRIDQNRVRTGQLTDDDWPRLTSAVGMLSEAPMFIDDTPAMSPSEMKGVARRLVREHGELGLIVIDYLQLMRVPGNKEGRVSEISEISRSLKGLAKELNVPVIALSQLNRGLEQRPNKRPVMSDLRESGAIEQDADNIFFVYRDEVYNDDTPDKGMAEIIIGKQRNGPIGTVRLTFLGQFTRFENFMPTYAEQQ